MPPKLPLVYPITDKGLSGRHSHLSILKELARGGARWVQIRDKSTPAGELLLDLLRCVEFAAQHDIQVIIDDRCDLAMCSSADGVHLGQTDLPPGAARKILGPNKIIGYSTHTLAQVRAAGRLPIDYMGYGPIFPTATKGHPDPVVGLRGLSRACRASAVPVVAIGGIVAGQIRAVLEAGASSAAVISILMKARCMARQMEALLQEATGRR